MSAATELETDVRESDEGSPPPKRRKISPGPIPHSPASLRAAPPPSSLSQRFLRLEEEMCQELSLLQFGSPVTHVYQPLSYAAEPHRCYVQSYCHTRKRVLFFGMNPGPFGMAQTGVGGHYLELINHAFIHIWRYVVNYAPIETCPTNPHQAKVDFD